MDLCGKTHTPTWSSHLQRSGEDGLTNLPHIASMLPNILTNVSVNIVVYTYCYFYDYFLGIVHKSILTSAVNVHSFKVKLDENRFEDRRAERFLISCMLQLGKQKHMNTPGLGSSTCTWSLRIKFYLQLYL